MHVSINRILITNNYLITLYLLLFRLNEEKFTAMVEEQQLTVEFAKLQQILKELVYDTKNGQIKITLELNNYDETAELHF